MEFNQEAQDQLSEAHLKLVFIDFALSFMSQHASIESEQISGLAYIIKDIREGMAPALNCNLCEKESTVKSVKLA